MYCPKWVTFWLFLSALICTWDAGFVLMRPRSMAGGDLSDVWYPYLLYVTVDRLYGDLNDRFVYYQSILNICEVILNLFSFFLITCGSNKVKYWGSIFAIIVSAFTFWKTILYSLYGEVYASHNDWTTYILLYLIPNSTWILMPFICMIGISYRISKFVKFDQKEKQIDNNNEIQQQEEQKKNQKSQKKNKKD